MGLFSKLTGELIDIVEWTESSTDTMVYRFERYGNEMKNGAKLTVRESQMAVFVNEGQFADVFSPGMHTLTTQNLPILSTLKGWKHGFTSPFKAEIYFISTKNFTDQKWGTKNAITLDDPRFGMVEIRAFGTFATKITDSKLFLKEVVGTDEDFTAEKIAGQLKSLIVTRFTDAAAESGITIEKFAANMDELSILCQEKMNKEFGEYGLKLTKFYVENVSMPDDIKKEIHGLSRLGRVDAQKLAQMNAAKAIEIAAANPSGGAGAAMGMGMGFGMANQMTQTFANANASANSAPPSLNQMSLFVALDGKQAGPFNEQTLEQMVQGGTLKSDTLIWKTGMPAWIMASELPEVAKLLSSLPPKLP